ncbi:L-dopachrome tautomerase yellow-f2-like isoform X2 [Choristoneura fumiferana]|uniref:L-dopachrome tautomerase yellow-f2-like isoform X2 n=1 Tax=Choristoneura fumiferana TaxID=7141 RepID=UPI003D158346
MSQLLRGCLLLLAVHAALAQNMRRLGKFEEVFAWKQMTYNINDNLLLSDRFSGDNLADSRVKRQSDGLVFNEEANWQQQSSLPSSQNSWSSLPSANKPRPFSQTRTTTTRRPNTDEAGRFFIQYNNVPMGMERVGNRLFISLPRRRYGIPTTLNYIDLDQNVNTRSPALNPYPDILQGRNLTSVYRTRADECGRLWMVDTGLLELPVNPIQIQPPAIVVFDLNTDSQIFRYQFKSTDIPAANTPTGLASITVDVIGGDCSNTFAYVPDLTTFGIIVFSLRDNDSWRLSHNFFSFNPTAGALNIAGHRFQWSDGIFSITLREPEANGCRTAYFHALVSTQEFAVNTCLLRNRTASSDSNYWQMYSLVGDRGSNSQSTMHGYHQGSQVIFFADIGRDAVSCWKTTTNLDTAHVAILAQDKQRMSYPSDLHVTGDEVWVIANTLPRFGYSRLDTNEYNFYIYRGRVNDLIAGTVCDSSNYMTFG